jgi:hypothetical protein
MNIKIQQGTTFENLKTFIWLTNEYGVPSSKYLDFFIFNFGQIILNGNFTFNKYDYEQLDELKDAVIEECESNTVEYTSNYGKLFYKIVGTKALDILKEELSEELWNSITNDEKLEELKRFITDFDKYIPEEIKVQKVYFDNTPNLIKTDEIGRKYIEIHKETKGKLAIGHMYEDNTIFLQIGSEIRLGKLNTDKLLGWEISRDKNNSASGKLTTPVKCFNVASATSMATGNSTDGWNSWKNAYDLPIDIYRTKGGYEEAKKQELKKQAESAANLLSRIQAEGLDAIHTEGTTKVNQQETLVQESIKQYILRDRHINKIGAPVSYNNDAIGEIVSEKEIKVGGHTVSIGEYIYNNKLDTEKLTFGCYRFNTLYKEDN